MPTHELKLCLTIFSMMVIEIKASSISFLVFLIQTCYSFFAYLYTGFQPKKKSEHRKIYMQLAADNLLSKLVIALFCLRSNLNNLCEITYV